MIQVAFNHPEETDLVFFYLEKQMQQFDEDNIPRPAHRILVGEKEIIVELKYPPSGDANPDWPVGPTDDGT